MPNIVNQELVRAFNIILCHNEVAITNFTVQSTDQTFFKKEDRIVISFDKNMDVGQCMEYLHNIRESIVETFCGSESGANMSFNTKFFPFNFNESQLTKDKEGYKFSVPIDKDIVLNLKCLLANGLARDVTGAMGRDFGLEYVEEYTSDESFDRKSYLYCMRFYDKRLQDYFVESFSSKVKDYKNSPKKTGDFLKIKDNRVYIKASIFDDVKFIKDIIKHKASLECRDFEVPSSEDENVENLKFSIIALLRGMGIPADTILHTSYTGSGENSVLVPIIQITSGIEGKENCRLLNKEEVSYVNRAFGMGVLRNVQDYTSPKHLPVFGNGGVYGIDFYDKDISYCVLNKIMESSVINKDHELAIDPERVLLPAQSPVKVPNGPSSSLTGSSSSKQESPTGSQSKELEGPPRWGFIGAHSGLVSVDQVDVPGMSREFPPSPQLNSIAVSCVVQGPSSSLQSVGAAQNVRASTIAWTQPMDRWSLPAPSAGLWSLPQSRPSSWKGANKSGSAWTSQPIGYWSSQSSNLKEDCKKICEDFEEAYEKIVSDSSLSKEEQELFKALLYWFNLNNYALDPPHTNFIVKNGKIVSFLHENVDREKYLQAVRDYIIEKYCETEEEARKVYDLDEFPFKLNYEEKQGKTVVANISSGALSNLKILFSREFEKNVDAIDISAVKKVEKREKDEWVDRQKSKGCSLEEACENCFPDEEAMKTIPIAFDEEEDEYVLNRSYDICEVKLLFREQLRRFRGTSKAGQGKPEDNKDSGYSSGFVTDAGKVSSKAEATTSGTSGYESMDCENTERNPLNRKSSSSEGSSSESSRSGSSNSSPKSDGENTGGTLRKRKVQSPEDGGSPEKSLRRDSSPLSRLESLSLSSSSHQIGK